MFTGNETPNFRLFPPSIRTGDALSWDKNHCDTLAHEFKLMDEMIKQADKLSLEVERSGEMLEHIEPKPTFRKHQGAELIPVRELMDTLAKQDQEKNRPKWGALTRRQTPEGDIIWLCGEHLKKFQSRRPHMPAPPDGLSDSIGEVFSSGP